MFRRKTITRITRFMLLSMLMSYCMSFTVCAEEDPVTGMLAGGASRMVYAADDGEEVIGITDVAVETSEDADTEDEVEVSEEPLAGSEYNIRAIDYKLGDRHQIIVRFENDYYTIPGNITINYNGKTATAECVERGEDYLVPIEWVSFDVEDDVINNFSANLYSDWGMSGANVTIDEYTEVHDNVIDADNFFDVFKYNYKGNRLYDYIDTDSTLYFAGDFPTSYGQGNYSMIIDRPVNIDTEVGGARFTRQSYVSCDFGCAVNVINFTSEASGSSIRNIYFENGTIVVNATDIVIDSVSFDTGYEKRNTKSIDVSEQSNNTLIKNSTMNEVQISGNMTMLEYCDIKGDSHRFYQTGGYLHNNTIVNCQVSGTGIEISGNDFKSSLTVNGEENRFSKNRFECSPEVTRDENQLWDNTFDYGISLNSDGNYFQNNTMTGNLIVHGKNNAIYDNTNTAGDIQITGKDNCLINNNIGNNLYAASADNLVVEDCTVALDTEIAGNATEFTGNEFGGEVKITGNATEFTGNEFGGKVKITGNTTTICRNEIAGTAEVIGEGIFFSDNIVNGDSDIKGDDSEICRNIFNLDAGEILLQNNSNMFYDNRVNDGKVKIYGEGSRLTNNIIKLLGIGEAVNLHDQSRKNTISDNKIVSTDLNGKNAINDEGTDNLIERNGDKLPTNLTINADNIAFGQKAVVRVSINYFATKDVDISLVDGDDYKVPVSKGAGVLEIPGLVPGNYSILSFYAGDEDVRYGECDGVTFTVGKTANALTTLPAAKEGLIANNSTQELITKGVNIAGKLEYALGTDETTVPTAGWSESVPTATEAGIYYVWYRLTGDDKCESIAPVCIKVEIKEEAKEEEEQKEDTVPLKPDEKYVSDEDKDVIVVPVIVYEVVEKEVVVENTTIKVVVSENHLSAVTYKGRKITPEDLNMTIDTKSITSQVTLLPGSSIKEEDLVTARFVQKNNVNANIHSEKQATIYAKLVINKGAKKALSKDDYKKLKKLVKEMNKEFKTKKVAYTINPASVIDSKLAVTAKLDKNGKIRVKNGKLKNLKSVKAQPLGAEKVSKLSKKQYEIKIANEAENLILVKGMKNYTGTVQVKVTAK